MSSTITHPDARFWDNLAERYAARPVDNPDAFERKKAVTKAGIRPGDRILEIGCGTGTLAVELAPLAGHVHAIDVSKEMVRIAQGRAKKAGVENVTFQQLTAEELTPEEPPIFDGVLAYSIVHLVDDPAATVKRLYDVLKPGGFFISSTVVLGGSWMPYGLILPTMRLFGQAPKVHLLTGAQVDGYLRDAGFVGLETPDVGAGSNVHFLVAEKPAA